MSNFIFLAIGLFTGGVVAWLIIRIKVEVAETRGRCTGDVDRASLLEQLKGATKELASKTSDLIEAQ